MNLRNPVLRYTLLGFGVGILGILVSTILILWSMIGGWLSLLPVL